jgi:hypothetical protein
VIVQIIKTCECGKTYRVTVPVPSSASATPSGTLRHGGDCGKEITGLFDNAAFKFEEEVNGKFEPSENYSVNYLPTVRPFVVR